MRRNKSSFLLLLTLAWFTGCATVPKQDPAVGAKSLFDQTVKQYHLPSAEAEGTARDQLLQQAAEGYERLLKIYPKQTGYCAQALRSLANVRAEQGHQDEAVRLYGRVAEKYPREDWEIVQAWKSAGDLLWDAGRKADAKTYYTKLISRFDRPEAPAVVKTIIKGARQRLTEC